MAIDELLKPAGDWCRHCKPGHGCSVYEDRPNSCATFACLWLAAPSAPEEYRPDRSKVLVLVEASGARVLAHCDPVDPFAWKREPIYGFLKQQASRGWEAGVHVVAKAGQQFWLLTPAEDMDLGYIAPDAPYRISVSLAGNIEIAIQSKTAVGGAVLIERRTTAPKTVF